MATYSYTPAVDGYRWKLSVWEGIFKAHAQQRMTAENGKIAFRFVGIPAFFDKLEKRTAFVRASHPKSWAEKWKRPVVEYYQPALRDSLQRVLASGSI
jgi:hypothetical protein